MLQRVAVALLSRLPWLACAAQPTTRVACAGATLEVTMDSLSRRYPNSRRANDRLLVASRERRDSVAEIALRGEGKEQLVVFAFHAPVRHDNTPPVRSPSCARVLALLVQCFGPPTAGRTWQEESTPVESTGGASA